MKPLFLVSSLTLAALAGAQTAPKAPAAKVPASRVDRIMDFANDRMSTQIDAMFDDGDFLAVISLLRLQAEQYPSDYDVWTNLGWMQENVQAYDAALATYVRYKRQNPQDPDANFPEANFYFMRKLYAKVPPLLETAIKGPCHPNCFRILARAYEQQGMLSDSLRVYKALTVRDPKDLTAKANVKRVEGKIGEGTEKK
jgi:tetratricopeptide (TPR) repeat protein